MPPKRQLSEQEREAAKQRKAEYDRQRRQAIACRSVTKQKPVKEKELETLEII